LIEIKQEDYCLYSLNTVDRCLLVALNKMFYNKRSFCV